MTEMQASSDMVCLECGSEVGRSKTRKWVHTEEIPRTARSHDAAPVSRADYLRVKRVDAILTPLNEARAYARKIQEQMQREEMQGVKWDDAARHAVVLLVALEATEMELLSQVGEQRSDA